jgi:hypothetical protein
MQELDRWNAPLQLHPDSLQQLKAVAPTLSAKLSIVDPFNECGHAFLG